MFITEKGNVYACGWNADGQTGQNNYESNWEPKPVTGDIVGEDIVKLSCAGDCVLALNSKYYDMCLSKVDAKMLHMIIYLTVRKRRSIWLG